MASDVLSNAGSVPHVRQDSDGLPSSPQTGSWGRNRGTHDASEALASLRLANPQKVFAMILVT